MQAFDWQGAFDGVGALVARVIAPTPLPSALETGLIAALVAAAVLIPASWRVLRHGITIVHEAGHALAATLTGRRLAGIRLHSDTSGLTVSVGRPTGPGMVATLLAGYPAASFAGIAVAWAVGSGRASAALWASLLVLVLVLVQVRNWFGLWSVLVAGITVAAATWLLDPAWQTRIATVLSGVLLGGGLRAILELPAARRRGRPGSDADQLARITRVPGWIWVGLFGLVGVLAPFAAGWLLGLHR